MFVNAIMYYKVKDATLAVANVDDAKVELSPDLLSFSARGRGKPLVFELRLRLEQRILPAASSWSFEVARTQTLALTLILTLTLTLILTLTLTLALALTLTRCGWSTC